MCKEADEPEQPKAPVQVVIPDDLPGPGQPTEIPANAIIPPVHTCEAPKKENPESMAKFDDIPLSDINEASKAR